MDKYYTMMTEQYGRGVYANTNLKKGDILFFAELLVLSAQDTKVVNTTDLQYYTFKYTDTQDCLVLGDGEIFNHSDNAQVVYDLISLNGRHMMQFTLLCDVNKDDQLFIDYTYDTPVYTDKYNINLVG